MNFRYLNRIQIDTGKWDDLISHSEAENLYAYSWYLDAVAERWSALVGDDYRVVMPLVWKRKFGIRYLYQPFYTQQLGAFSETHVDPFMITSMLSLVARKFRMGTFHFNHRNLVGEVSPFSVEDRTNYILPLPTGYDSLFRAYSENARRNVKKALEINPEVTRDMTVGELVSLKLENDVVRRSEKEVRWLVNLLENVLKRSSGTIYASRHKGETDAATIFGISRTRAIYLLSASTEKGMENRAMFKVVDAFIRDHAGSGLILDFEGSNIPGVARFFSGFGSIPETYQKVRFNRLPLPVIRRVKPLPQQDSHRKTR